MPIQVSWSSRPTTVMTVAGIVLRLSYSDIKTKLNKCYFCVTPSEANARHRSRRRHDDEQVVVLVVRNRHLDAGESLEDRRQGVRVTDDEHYVIGMRLDLRDQQSGVFRANLLDRNAGLRGQRLCRVLRALELGRENVFHAGVRQHRREFLCARLTRSRQWRI